MKIKKKGVRYEILELANGGSCNAYLSIKHHLIAFSVSYDVIQILCQLQTFINMCFKSDSSLKEAKSILGGLRKRGEKCWGGEAGCLALDTRDFSGPWVSALCTGGFQRLPGHHFLFSALCPRCFCSPSCLSEMLSMRTLACLYSFPRQLFWLLKGKICLSFTRVIMGVINDRRAGQCSSCGKKATVETYPRVPA